MFAKIAVLACVIAAANAGDLGAVAYESYGEPSYAAGYAASTLAATSENVYRSAGNLNTISTQSRTIATPHSTSNKHFTSVTNPGVYAQTAYAAPVATYAAAAPVATYGAPVASYAAHAAPVATYAAAAPIAHATYAAAAPIAHATYAAAAPIAHATYAAAPVASHTTYSAAPLTSASPIDTGYTGPAPIATGYAAPAPIATGYTSYAAPIATGYAAHAAPVAGAYAAGHGYSAGIGYAAGHGYAARSAHPSGLLGVAYSPAVAVSHMTYSSPVGVNYSW